MPLAEERRLQEDRTRSKNWKRWGPYLSERQWGTCREDYSVDGSCWEYFPHEHARSRTYRWGEDGLLGITDRQARLCLSFSLWNGKDPILKERLFGLTNSEGNHGEDVKELYYYLDSTPSHSYMKALYRYPHQEFPYSLLVTENGQRGHTHPELELEDTGAFNQNRFFDVYAEYGKDSPDDILARYTVINRGPEAAKLHFIPTVWYRNTWIWGCTHEGCTMRPNLKLVDLLKIQGNHESLGKTMVEFDSLPNGSNPTILFTNNETNTKLLFGEDQYTPYVKDAFHNYVIKGEASAVSPKASGTKVGAHYVLDLQPGEQTTIRVRMYPAQCPPDVTFGASFEQIMKERIKEADEFYLAKIPNECINERAVIRQAYAGLLWSKQFYHYIIKNWLEGDPEQPPPPEVRKKGRNCDWKHLFNRDIISMPDKWEYPWYASWDLAFHMIPFANIDIDFAKDQLQLFLREWYMHPNGQIPAYEFNFGDVNPPVHAWAVINVFKKSGPKGQRDYLFLARCFQKLLINFTWWVNRKDPDGRNIFSGGFLGLDNIGVFDRSRPLPVDGVLEQADGTAWMAFFCVIMLDIALELAEYDSSYEDMASKFFEHFTEIVDACNNFGGSGLWDPRDGFYYDHLRTSGSHSCPLRVRSLVGIMPIISCLVLEDSRIQKLKGFWKRTQWFLQNRQDLGSQISFLTKGCGTREDSLLLAVPTKDQLIHVLNIMLDENEFLSPYGIRSLSKVHDKEPYVLDMHGERYEVSYVPGESNTSLFGGNSNWRGPIWFPINYLIVECLQRYDYYYGEELMVECPTGSGNRMRLKEVAMEISRRLSLIFLPDASGRRPCHGDSSEYAEDPIWKDLVLFYEFFHGDTGRGCGASHQTGWTALVTSIISIAKGGPNIPLS